MMYRQDGRLGAEFPQSELVISSSCSGEGGGSEAGRGVGVPRWRWREREWAVQLVAGGGRRWTKSYGAPAASSSLPSGQVAEF